MEVQGRNRYENAYIVFGLMTFGTIILGIYYIFTKIFGGGFPTEEVQMFYVAGFALIILIVLLEYVDRWIGRGITEKMKTGLIIASLILLLLVMFGLVTRNFNSAGTMINALFVSLAALFPAMLYYLFVSSRKYGLLEEFQIKLEKLGFKPSVDGPYGEYEYYMDRFETIYGEATDDKNKRRGPDGPEEKSLSQTARDIFKSETILPVILATLLIAPLWFMVLPIWNYSIGTGWVPLEDALLLIEQGGSLNSPVTFAFLGAYWFSIQMLVRRYFRRDLRSSTYVTVSMRITIAIIGIWAVDAIGIFNNKPSYLNLTGFVIGVFPQTAWQLIEESFKVLVSKTPRIGSSFRTPLPLRELDGVTVWNEARFREEDIENIPQMATADIPNLMLTTRIAPERIIEWVDQAILYTHIGPEDDNCDKKKKTKTEETVTPSEKKEIPTLRKRLRSYGITNATSLIEVMEKNGNSKIDIKTDSKVQSLVVAVSTHPNLKLIKKWKSDKN